MEQTSGVKLLLHTPKGFELTEAGEEIIEDVRLLDNISYTIARKLVGKDQRLSGSITITMPHDLFNYYLSDCLVQFRAQYPDIELNLSLTNSIQNLSLRESDIAIRFTKKPPEDLVGYNIAMLQHAVYSSKKLDNDTETSKNLILWNDEVVVPSWATERFKKCHIALKVDDLESMYKAVSAGFGVACMPCYLPRLLSDKNIKLLGYVDSLQSDWGLWVLNHVDVKNSMKVKLLRKVLIDTLNQKVHQFSG
ncbi:hypothetical protein PAUR_a2692 [Pseudoalteromonas aurantia 208]|uniref:LysR substrate-binding domain-containing protein n=2 Tax=Pseudoalteromonas aurantia TaxID=43654 RepID=A0ABR9ED92_9GAMM|nr:hypothetical protein [Pseudoalteromonas aurantia 208]